MRYKTLLITMMLLLCGLFTTGAAALELDQQVEATENLIPAEENWVTEEAPVLFASVPTYTSGEQLFEIIRTFEGFVPTKVWDVSSYAIGYGSRYSRAEELFGKGIERITEEQAIQIVKADVAVLETYLNNFLVKNNIVVNQNQFDALMDFTYNGIGWMSYKNEDGTWCKLHELLLKDPSNWTSEAVHEAFGTWVKANGVVLPGLVRRRAAEADLFMTPCDVQNDTQPGDDTVSDSVYTDVPAGAWYYEDVHSAYELGLMKGIGNNLFAPNMELTRGQVVQVLANLEGVKLENVAAAPFADVAVGQWYTPAVAWAASQGYVNGYDDGNFYPLEPITREQLCTILTRYLKDKGVTCQERDMPFGDADKISGFAREGVAFCYHRGLVNGVGNGLFDPKSGANRAQMATILVRMVTAG